MLKTIVRIAIAVAILVILVNEVGHWVQSEAIVHNASDSVIAFGQKNGRLLGRDVAAQQAVSIAQQEGVKLISYGQTDTQVYAVIQIEVPGSIVIGPIVALIHHQPLNTPYTLATQGTGTLQ